MLRVLAAAAVILGLMSGTVQSNELKFHTLWHADTPMMYVTSPLSREDFRARTQQYTAAGRQLVDIETAVQAGQRTYVGLWVGVPKGRGRPQNLVQGPLPPDALQDKVEALAPQGLRLSDIELMQGPGRDPQILGVWQAGDGAQMVQTGLPMDRLRARTRSFRHQGLYLADLEATQHGGEVRYTALWRTGDHVQVITRPRDVPSFQRLTYVMERRGFHLADLVTLWRGGRVLLGGVWTQGMQAALVSRNDSTEGFAARGWHESQAGRGVADIELSPGVTGQFPDSVVGGRMDALSLKHF